jgi:type VII secretion-associated serine protease mycosin
MTWALLASALATAAFSFGPTLASPAAAATACGPAGNFDVTDTPWALRRLDPSALWSITRGNNVTVAVIDSGVSDAPPILAGRLDRAHAKDFTGEPGASPFCDQVGHGTFVASIIAGRDGGRVTGIAPGATILSLRAVPKETNTESLTPNVATAIRYAADHGAKVINLSLSTPPTDQLQSAVNYALSKDIVIVAAAGNEKAGDRLGPSYPAAYDGVIAVAGVDEDGKRVETSISGNYVDVAAPGANIVGPAARGSGYILDENGGTSFAAAYVSGVAALLRSYDTHLTAPQVVARIELTADRPAEGYSNDLGYGVVNPYRALNTIVDNRGDPPVAALPPVRFAPDPFAQRRVIAIWAAVGGLVLASSLLFGGRILRAGRRRQWRPGAVPGRGRSG